jgi:hypothetical protein
MADRILTSKHIGFFCVLFLWAWLLQGVVAAELSEAQWTALAEGQVMVDSTDDEHGVPGVRVMFLVGATREVIWATLLDYDNFTQLFHGIDRMKVLHEDVDGASIELWVDAIFKKLHYILDRSYVDPEYRLTWKRTSGDLKDIHGSWDIFDGPDDHSKLLVYKSFVDTGFAPITWAVRLGTKSKAQDTGYRLRDRIESRQ